MSFRPWFPVTKKGQESPTIGLTRYDESGLIWFDTSFLRWVPAVRLDDIRDQLLHAANSVGAYRFPRGAGEGNNVTAPLADDLNYGGDWANRPPVLFEFELSGTHYLRNPITVMEFDGKIVLDPYDNPIRDFGNELPVVLSSEIKGWEIEFYMRRNIAIRPYDFIARCPSSYTIKGKLHTKPPSIHTMLDRATRFRERAGLMSWDERSTSDGARRYIESLLPPGATDTYALGGDLSKEQLAARKAANRGYVYQRKKKALTKTEEKANAGHMRSGPEANARVQKSKVDDKSKTGPN